MRTIFFTAIFSLTTTVSLFAADTNVLSDVKMRASYALGMMLATTWTQQGVDVDNNLVLRGLNEKEAGGPMLLTIPEMQAALQEYQQITQAKQQKLRAEMAVKNKSEGASFLATNKNNPGVITLPDGLQYKILVDGNGATPTPSDTVTVNYRGTFINGTEFDSSAATGRPAKFGIDGVIPGWTEALLKMKVGSKWQLFIPAELAYGERGRINSSISPNAVLIFEVELLNTETPPPITSDIIKVPSNEEMKHGAKIETIKPEDLQKFQSQSKTN